MVNHGTKFCGAVYLIFLAFAVMRWLVIALLVSLLALIIAAAGMARHILQQRKEQRRKRSSDLPSVVGSREETDIESEL